LQISFQRRQTPTAEYQAQTAFRLALLQAMHSVWWSLPNKWFATHYRSMYIAQHNHNEKNRLKLKLHLNRSTRFNNTSYVFG